VITLITTPVSALGGNATITENVVCLYLEDKNMVIYSCHYVNFLFLGVKRHYADCRFESIQYFHALCRANDAYPTGETYSEKVMLSDFLLNVLINL